MYNKTARIRELTEKIKTGQKAESLLEIAALFLMSERRKAADDLLNTTRPAEQVRMQLKAAENFAKFVKLLANEGKTAEHNKENLER